MKAITTNKITVAAAGTAVAVAFCAVAAFLPLSVTPLIVCSLCIYTVNKKSGLIAGILCALATLGLTFLMKGLSMTFIFLCLAFIPYAFLAFFLSPLTYGQTASALLRAVITAAFAAAVTIACYFTAKHILLANTDIDLSLIANKIGGLAVLSLLAAVAFVPVDFMFWYTANRLMRAMKI